jgi:hypothetical protein
MRRDDSLPSDPAPAPRGEREARAAYVAPRLKQFGAVSALTENNMMMGQMDGFMGRRTG